MIDDLQRALDSLAKCLEDVDIELSRTELLEQLKPIQDIADSLSIEEIRCKRCDRRFRSIPEVEYCTKECELGQTRMPYQTRASQADLLFKAERGRV